MRSKFSSNWAPEDEWELFLDSFRSSFEVLDKDIEDEWDRIKNEFGITDEEVFKALSKVVEDPYQFIEGTELKDFNRRIK